MSSPALSQNSTSSALSTSSAAAANLGADLKPQGETAAKVKPCCVCKDEKQSRDECMLFSTAADPQKDCEGMVDKYRICMRGFGFEMR